MKSPVRLPDGWKEVRLRYVAQIQKGRLPSSEGHSGETEHLVPYLSMEYLRGTAEARAVDKRPMVLAEPKDTLVLWDGSNAGEVIPGQNGAVSSTLARLRPIGVDASYFFWACRYYEPRLKDETIGMGIPHVSGEFLRDLAIPIPTESRQKTIASVLDRETARIDALVRSKERLIALLDEKRQALITRAVTKGLDPSVPMKDSGVEWIGEVPEHWDVTRLSYLSNLIQTGPFGSQLNASEYSADGIPVINPSHIIDGVLQPDQDCTVAPDVAQRLSRHQMPEDAIVMGRRGDLGRAAVVTSVHAGALCGTGSLQIRPKNMKSEYAVLQLMSRGTAEWLSLHSVGATMENLNADIVGRIPMIEPPVGEQDRIIEHVGEISVRFSDTIHRLQQSITLLRERCQSLITAAVTGQLEIPDAPQEASA